MNNQGITFLNKIYSELVNSNEVKHTVYVVKNHDFKYIFEGTITEIKGKWINNCKRLSIT